jgi:adenylate kinase
MRLILLGPPGSGKGTQATGIAEKCSIPAVSTGDLFRKNIAEGTDLGKKAESYTKSGKLVPDDLVLDMVADRLSQADCEKGYLLDGFPRTVPQAEGLKKMLAERGADLDHVVQIDVADEEIVERLSARRTCEKCGAIYNLKFSPPSVEGVCDKCGSDRLQQRADDVPETIRQRLSVYHDQTAPLVEYYREAGLLRPVDGSQPPKKVAEAIAANIS